MIKKEKIKVEQVPDDFCSQENNGGIGALTVTNNLLTGCFFQVLCNGRTINNTVIKPNNELCI
ncbi:hypothetical protein LGR97_10165 [Klebsiella quasipneumoniae subsp. similipneumoniae]|uniref:hypothetical protein n=1 Tax=Klebsiella TaxID=570 RepID=UPI001157E906|nr:MULTISPECIES: hypothetical protein [Klebsiella]MCF2309936.1 hypothetical protein [Klebsiella quasipneumoniae subsp. similipneumoniae]MDQ9495639.1 hypothetical protein [Klebsiella aerogenes]QNC83324.1 hypothetical protein F3109_07310 [Klebsiella quasipneumoniae]HBV6657874.1 hypothetical protein [Klebsiella aerogenes]HBV9911243.1 hypothetical protein [Klebsiella aerogenes]